MIRGNSPTVVGNEDNEYRELEKEEVRKKWEEDMGIGAGKCLILNTGTNCVHLFMYW